MSLQHRDPFHYIDAFDDPVVRQLVRFPCEEFKDLYPSDPRWTSYFSQFSVTHTAYRPCDSDHRSLLRAFSFAFFESLTRAMDPPLDRFSAFREELRSEENVFKVRPEFRQSVDILAEVLDHFREICDKGKGMAMFHAQTLLGKRWFDKLFRDLLRMVLLNYVELHAEDEPDDWDYMDLTPDECASLISQDVSALDEKFVFLLSKTLKVTVTVFNFAGDFDDNSKYLGGGKDPDFVLYREDGKFGVLYSREELDKDQFDLKTRRYDVGTEWEDQDS